MTGKGANKALEIRTKLKFRSLPGIKPRDIHSEVYVISIETVSNVSYASISRRDAKLKTVYKHPKAAARHLKPLCNSSHVIQ